jgi:hypothetical protein
MINILGIKRIVTLASLLALVGILAFLNYSVFAPQLETKEQEKNTLQGQINTVRNDLNSIQIEFSLLEEQRGSFDKLEAMQFFERQDRRKAEEILEVIQERSHVLSAKTAISGGVLEDHPEAQRAQYKILNSPLQIEIAAMEDTDIFRYIWLLENRFPGYIDVQSLTFDRMINVDRELLQKIISGELPTIVTAKMEASWKTMIPETDALVQGESLQGGVQ